MGLPLRSSIANLNRRELRGEARRHLGLAEDQPVVLIFGGSQGARRLNDVLAGSLSGITAAGIQVLHSVGNRNEVPSGRPGYVPVSYIERMDLAYAASDLVVCRSGAMTCAELTAVGLPGIYVPLPIGNGEQAGNSQPIVNAGGGLQQADQRLTSEWLTATVLSVVQDESRLEAMSSAAYALGERKADQQLAEWIVDVARLREG
jgi:UDP-N-acetylglucosamine--N-acetylmuramyl-(pentapeptide) pyrophosphoryl-undecaprenol N-acetylglucosamine transferase